MKSLGQSVLNRSVALVGLVLIAPVLLLIGLAIKLEDNGPIFFKQWRVGYQGKLFQIFKFRTMFVNADKKGSLITIGRDPRITRIGQFLRKYKLDELPQLINVLRGDMKFVGPRPEVEKYVKLYSKDQLTVLEYLPGITDVASLKFIDESAVLAKFHDPEAAYIEKIMPEKIRLNLEYQKNASIVSDIRIIFQTLFKIAD